MCLASFGFHGNVSSLLQYFRGDARKVSRALWGGTLIALVVYALWQLAVQGNLPRSAFGPVIAAEGKVGVLIAELSKFTATGSMAQILAFFSYTAIASSFLGVTLGLFDYITDLFGFDDSRAGRSKAALITFLPPLLFSLRWPGGFVTVIAYVGLVATVWTALTPAALLYAARKKFGTGRGYSVYGGYGMMLWVLLFGLANIAAMVLGMMGKLPVFAG